ncbi:hypothetical protein [Streptomyces sp. NPDC054854]
MIGQAGPVAPATQGRPGRGRPARRPDGWSPDVEETRQQDNPSARRSFHPEQYAPAKSPGRKVAKEEVGNPHGRPTMSMSSGGEDRSKSGSDEGGMRDTGSKGRSDAASETYPPSPASTCVDAQDPPGPRSGG